MLRVGIAGTRGLSTMAGFRANPHTEVVAMCDVNEETLNRVADEHGIEQRYRVFDDMLASDVDVVVVATPVNLHVAQSIAALTAGKHVLSEVTAAASMEELYWLMEAVERSGRTYMMAENYLYIPDVALMRELALSGDLGQVYLGEGEYLHNIRAYAAQPDGRPNWRSYWQLGRRGTFYPTHSLGPLMSCLPGDRVTHVVTIGSGRHHGLPLRQEDSTTTLCQLASGGMLRIRVDALSLRPHQTAYYQLQGTKGVVDFSRFDGEPAQVWIHDGKSDPAQATWQPLSDHAHRLPERYRRAAGSDAEHGHGGGDFFIVDDFVAAVRGEIPNPVDVYQAAEWTAVGLLSEVSIAAGGRPVEVPHFRPGMRLDEQVTRFA